MPRGRRGDGWRAGAARVCLRASPRLRPHLPSGRPSVYRTLYAFTGGRRDIAEECVAEGFARAIAHAGTIRQPLAWIYRTAFRLAAAELKREGRRTTVTPDQTVDAPNTGELLAALRELSPMQRAAIVLRYEADLPVAEIARRMGTASPTVRVHLHRGRNRLRELLGSEESNDD